MADAPRDRRTWAILLLAGAVITIYGQVATHDFVGFDDPGYVTGNPVVLRGLTWGGLRWAFTTGHMWNWTPLTWLSHMVDVQLFGLNAGEHHLVNVAFHLASTILLFTLLERTTRALWPSLTVAALFAVHPLHVESVAWIAERKDVLSTCLGFLTLYAYARYGEARSARWYVLALASFALGLMAKPMLVTLPFVLILLDVWPLGRLALGGNGSGNPRSKHGRKRSRSSIDGRAPRADVRPLASLVWEKIPFLVLTIVASTVTYYVQLSNGAIDQSGTFPIELRVANALVSYVRYLAMAVWPVDLAVFYPYDTKLPSEEMAGAALCLAGVSALVLRVARRHPYALVGWLWYLGTLVPVIGFVQAGSQAFADRFTYVPLVGVFIMLAWGVRDLLARAAIPTRVVAAAAIAMVCAYAVTASAQIAVWRDSAALFGHAARVTHGNYLAHNNLGVWLEGQGKLDAAVEEYREALRIRPDYADARGNLASAVRARYEHLVSLHPDDPAAHYALATSLRDLGRSEDAIEQYRHVLRLDPGYGDARTSLADALAERGRVEEAAEQYEQALRVTPDDPRIRFNLASSLAAARRPVEAVEEYRRVVRLKPDDAEAWGNLAALLAQLQQTAEAGRTHQKAVELARSTQQWALLKRIEDWQPTYQGLIDAQQQR